MAWRRRAIVKVTVGGQDVTAKMDPYLISVVVVDKMGSETDTCDLELDDSDARLALPQPGEGVSVSMGWESGGPGLGNVFSGTVTEVESGFARRGGGRRIWVTAESMNNFGLGKEPMNMSMGQGDLPDQETGTGPPIPFQAFASQVASAGGYSAIVDPILGAMQRPYWNVGGASPHHALQEFARTMGGFVKFMNDKVAIVSALSGFNPYGGAMGNVAAVWGENLISWRVKPFIARAMYAGAKADWFKIIQGAWQLFQGGGISNGAPFGGASAKAQNPQAGAGPDQAEQWAGEGGDDGGLPSDSTNERGAGWVMFDGDPRAKGGGLVTIKGARPGVDGTWRISEAEHHYSRASGYITRCNLMDPPDANSGRLSGHGWKPGQPQQGPPPEQGGGTEL